MTALLEPVPVDQRGRDVVGTSREHAIELGAARFEVHLVFARGIADAEPTCTQVLALERDVLVARRPRVRLGSLDGGPRSALRRELYVPLLAGWPRFDPDIEHLVAADEASHGQRYC